MGESHDVSQPEEALDVATHALPTVPRPAAARIAESRELALILEQVTRGDQSAFAEFYYRTRSRVYGMVLRVLRDQGLSEETVQEAYLQAWSAAE
ncbi:hypothetical protein R4P64_31000 [Rhodococcus sp. IEGM 1366]|uniref:hypothetical protein n=1 Tax=Rhodococcus sp. IEGM 1366 TaxID=3082223 RepID=UPI0029545F85|nr:hypothetical protein [Rhodococcus sp. IEGM 1366]MDV8070955.1 hypothetical protein [Rhodococcus sp. IEGM 1366]